MKKSLAILGLTFSFSLAHAQSSEIEISCRSEAKQVAVKTYQSCVTSARNQKIDHIRKEYQTKLNDLKKYYDSELNKISGSKKTAKASSNKLPEKLTPTTEALPVDGVQGSNTNQDSVIVVDPTENSAE